MVRGFIFSDPWKYLRRSGLEGAGAAPRRAATPAPRRAGSAQDRFAERCLPRPALRERRTLVVWRQKGLTLLVAAHAGARLCRRLKRVAILK